MQGGQCCWGLVSVRGDVKELDDVRESKVQAPRASLVIVGVRLQLKKEWRAFAEFGSDK